MTGDALDVAHRFLETDYSNWPADAFEVMTDDVVIHTSDGKAYFGHDGCALWFENSVRTDHTRVFTVHRVEQLNDEWVLADGFIRIHKRAGETEVQPGCWLIRVRDGLVSAFVYYRTVRAARDALANGPSRHS